MRIQHNFYEYDQYQQLKRTPTKTREKSQKDEHTLINLDTPQMIRQLRSLRLNGFIN